MADEAYPIKLDDDRTNHGTNANGERVVYSDYLYEGDKVGPLAEGEEFSDGAEAIFTTGIVVKRDDGLWIEAYRERSN